MERTSVIALHSWFATAGGIPKKCPLITAAVMVYMLYPVVLTFETITLLDVTKPQRFGKDALTEVAFIGVPMLVWFFVSVTALVCVVKREIVKYPLWNGGKTAQIIIGNFLIFLIFFTVAACISVMVHIDGRRSYLVAAAECFLIVWQISLFIYFDAYRINLKKRPKRIESELSDRTRTVYIIVPVECHQIAGSNETEGLPSYDEIAQTYENNQVVPVV